MNENWFVEGAGWIARGVFYSAQGALEAGDFLFRRTLASGVSGTVRLLSAGGCQIGSRLSRVGAEGKYKGVYGGVLDHHVGCAAVTVAVAWIFGKYCYKQYQKTPKAKEIWIEPSGRLPGRWQVEYPNAADRVKRAALGCGVGLSVIGGVYGALRALDYFTTEADQYEFSVDTPIDCPAFFV